MASTNNKIVESPTTLPAWIREAAEAIAPYITNHSNAAESIGIRAATIPMIEAIISSRIPRRTASVGADATAIKLAASKVWERIDSNKFLTLPSELEIRSILESEIRASASPSDAAVTNHFLD